MKITAYQKMVGEAKEYIDLPVLDENRKEVGIITNAWPEKDLVEITLNESEEANAIIKEIMSVKLCSFEMETT